MKFLTAIGFLCLVILIYYFMMSKYDRLVVKEDLKLLYKYIRMNLPQSSPDSYSEKKRIAIVSFDNRTGGGYIEDHDKNMQKYCNLWGYDYIRKYDKPDDISVYWYKVQLVRDVLSSNQYDYVMWIDTDAIISDYSRDLSDIITPYDKDIIVGSDKSKSQRLFDVANAGVFIIRNSEIGLQFMNDWLNEMNTYCYKSGDKLRGIWAMSCYEQGKMNDLIYKKYYNYTTTLPFKYIYNGYTMDTCKKEDIDEFIIHMYGQKDYIRDECFALKV